jgi:hypothetical protein
VLPAFDDLIITQLLTHRTEEVLVVVEGQGGAVGLHTHASQAVENQRRVSVTLICWLPAVSAYDGDDGGLFLRNCPSIPPSSISASGLVKTIVEKKPRPTHPPLHE